jgi:transposase
LIRTVLRDDQWERIAPELPGKAGDPGATARDNRMFVEAVLWIARTGAPWRDLPEEFGNWYTVYTRFWRWARKGVWERIFKMLSDDPDLDRRAEAAVRVMVSGSQQRTMSAISHRMARSLSYRRRSARQRSGWAPSPLMSGGF